LSAVDVIVPCYRYGRFLTECVRSVLSQADVQVRVLVIDDASPDDTLAIATALSSDPRVSLLRHVQNKGHIATYNEGIEWARADYLLLLSADDFLLPGALARATTLLEQRAEVGFVFGNAVALSDDGTRRPIRTRVLSGWRKPTRVMAGSDFIRLTGATNSVPTPTAVVRTELQRRAGGYRSELPHSGDMEMWLRLASYADVGAVNADQAVYRRHSGNMSHEYQWLQDLEQREAAVRWFIRESGSRLRDGGSLCSHLLDQIGLEAVGAASAAFNEERFDLMRELSSYALRTSPGVNRSLPWMKLALKQRLGLAGWRVLNGVASSLSASSDRRGHYPSGGG
jgi:glycosyltransferase involved in cell wall biosynthesis